MMVIEWCDYDPVYHPPQVVALNSFRSANEWQGTCVRIISSSWSFRGALYPRLRYKVGKNWQTVFNFISYAT